MCLVFVWCDPSSGLFAFHPFFHFVSILCTFQSPVGWPRACAVCSSLCANPSIADTHAEAVHSGRCPSCPDFEGANFLQLTAHFIKTHPDQRHPTVLLGRHTGVALSPRAAPSRVHDVSTNAIFPDDACQACLLQFASPVELGVHFDEVHARADRQPNCRLCARGYYCTAFALNTHFVAYHTDKARVGFFTQAESDLAARQVAFQQAVHSAVLARGSAVSQSDFPAVHKVASTLGLKVCPLCTCSPPLMFPSRKELDQHVATHLRRCWDPDCGETYVMGSFSNHLLSRHSSTHVQCPECAEVMRIAGMDAHLEAVHQFEKCRRCDCHVPDLMSHRVQCQSPSRSPTSGPDSPVPAKRRRVARPIISSSSSPSSTQGPGSDRAEEEASVPAELEGAAAVDVGPRASGDGVSVKAQGAPVEAPVSLAVPETPPNVRTDSGPAEDLPVGGATPPAAPGTPPDIRFRVAGGLAPLPLGRVQAVSPCRVPSPSLSGFAGSGGPLVSPPTLSLAATIAAQVAASALASAPELSASALPKFGDPTVVSSDDSDSIEMFETAAGGMESMSSAKSATTYTDSALDLSLGSLSRGEVGPAPAPAVVEVSDAESDLVVTVPPAQVHAAANLARQERLLERSSIGARVRARRSKVTVEDVQKIIPELVEESRAAVSLAGRRVTGPVPLPGPTPDPILVRPRNEKVFDPTEIVRDGRTEADRQAARSYYATAVVSPSFNQAAVMAQMSQYFVRFQTPGDGFPVFRSTVPVCLSVRTFLALCGYEAFYVQTPLASLLRSHVGSSRVECVPCSQKFDSSSLALNHLRTLHEYTDVGIRVSVGGHLCDVCGAWRGNKRTMQKHRRGCFAEGTRRPAEFRCIYCGREFTRTTDARRHEFRCAHSHRH